MKVKTWLAGLTALVFLLTLVPVVYAEDAELNWAEMLATFDNAKDTSGWLGLGAVGGEGAVLSLDDTAANVQGGTGKSLKLDYNAGKAEYRLPGWNYLNEGIQMKGDGLQLWIKSDRAASVNLLFFDSDWVTKLFPGGADNTAFPLKVGENIIRVPWESLASAAGAKPKGTALVKMQVQLTGLSNDAAGTMWLDSVGYYSNHQIDPVEPLPDTHAADTVIVETFDGWAMDHPLSSAWKPLNALKNADGSPKGSVLSMNDNPAYTYGGKGKSIKVAYSQADAEWKCPGINYRGDILVTGDGLAFWVYTDRDVSVNITFFDEEYLALVPSTGSVLVPAGAAVVTVAWDSLVYSNGNPVPEEGFSLLHTMQIIFGNTEQAPGVAYIDAVGFTGVGDEAPLDIQLTPADSYAAWQAGGVVRPVEDFESYSGGDEDEEFTSCWFGENVTAALDKTVRGSGQALRIDMDYTVRDNAAVMKGSPYDIPINIGNGIRFWAKADTEYTFTLRLLVDENFYFVTLRTSTQGKLYQIPYSVLYNYQNSTYLDLDDPQASLQIGEIQFIVGSSFLNWSPAGNHDGKSPLYIDDIAFVDWDPSNDDVIQPFDKADNGVRIQAPVGCFPQNAGISVKDHLPTAPETQTLMKAFGNGALLGAMKEVAVYNDSGKAIDPTGGKATLTFDVPASLNNMTVKVFKTFMDNTVESCAATVQNGKATIEVYSLGTFAVVGYPTGGASQPTQQTSKPTESTRQPTQGSSGTDDGTGSADTGEAPIHTALLLPLTALAALLVCLRRKTGPAR